MRNTASPSPISTPLNAPSIIRSLKSPKCPIRNTLPALISRCPVTYQNYPAQWRGRHLHYAPPATEPRSASWNNSSAPDTTPPAPRPVPPDGWLLHAGHGGKDVIQPFFMQHINRFFQPVKQVGCGVNGKAPTHWPQSGPASPNRTGACRLSLTLQ